MRGSGTKTWYSVGDKNYGHCEKSEHTRVNKVKRILVTSMKMDPEYWKKVSVFNFITYWFYVKLCFEAL